MPVQRVALEDLEQAVETLERTSRIVAMSVTNGNAVLIVHEAKRGQGRETRDEPQPIMPNPSKPRERGKYRSGEVRS